MEGMSFAATLGDADASTGKSTQYFEMFGHRGVWHDGWKAVAYHWPGTSFDDDPWELYHLDADFNENHDLAVSEPERLAALQELWWEEAAANQVLPLDDRFGERFAENAARHAGTRTNFTFWSGMGHVPSDVAPDLRSRSYEIIAHVNPSGSTGDADGVLLAHGDATSGYSLFVRNGHLVHDLNIGGTHQIVTSESPVPSTATTLGFRMERSGDGPFPHGVGTLLVDGEPAGAMETDQIFWLMISWSGLDIGLDRGTTVADYDGSGRFMGPNTYTGELTRVTVDLVLDQLVDHDAAGDTELGRE
jgi:arylsulfatase